MNQDYFRDIINWKKYYENFFLDDEPEIFPMQYGGKARTIINIAKTFSALAGVDKVSILSRSIRAKKKEFIWRGINFKKITGYGMVRDILDEISECDIMNVHTCSFTMPFVGEVRALNW